MNYEDTPITKWFKIKNKGYIMSPKYFFFDGVKVTFLLERPNKCHNIGTIKWTEYDTKLIICCTKKVMKYANSDNIKFTELTNIAKTNFNISQIPILKSNLQKCIRRSKVEEAKSSALTILCLKSSELLRRLPIIILEDVMLNNDFLFLVWLMCAESKGFPINDGYMNKIINSVELLASFSKRDLCYKLDKLDIRKFKKLNNLNDNYKDVLWGIQLRKSYGGMKGDMKMLNYFTKLWYDRFSNGFTFSENEIKSNNIRLLRYNDIQLEAVDFHCSNITTFIKNKYNKYEIDDIKKAIWFYRSSYNKKTINEGSEDINEDYKEIWYNIHKYVDYSSKIIIKNMF